MTIGEICQKLSLSETTLRYYERQGVLYRIPRIAGTIRKKTTTGCRTFCSCAGGCAVKNDL